MAFLDVIVMLIGNVAAVLKNKKEVDMEASKTTKTVKWKVGMSKIVTTIQAIGVSAIAGALPINIY